MIEWKQRLRSQGSFLRVFIPIKKTNKELEGPSSKLEQYKIALVIGLTFIILLILLTPDILLQGYQWNLNEVTDKDIIAPFSFSVKNHEETERLRKAAEALAPIVYQLDKSVSRNIRDEILSILSTAQQITNREELINKTVIFQDWLRFPLSPRSVETLLRHWEYPQMGETFQLIINELERVPVLTEDVYKEVTAGENIMVWDEQTQQLLSFAEFSTQYNPIMSVAQFKDYISEIIQSNLPRRQERDIRNMIQELFNHIIEPNFILDSVRTKEEKIKIRDQIRPVMITISRGEIIVPALGIINADQKRILNELSENRLWYGFSIVLGRALLLFLFIYFTALYLKRYYPQISSDFHSLAPVCTLTVIIVVFAKVVVWLNGSEYLIPVAGFAMLAGILFEIRFALILTTEMAVLLGVMLGLDVKHVMIFLAAGTIASFSVARIINRADLVKAGLRVSLINILGIGALFLFDYPLFSVHEGKWVELGWDLVAGAGNGLICYAITVGLLPLFEWVFNMTTDIKLLEYSDTRAPALAKIEQESPGTYQHSLNVGQLAEAAALAVGANALLCRLGGYYQDLGKMVTPGYFTENHRNEEDRKRHDKLTPHMSCLVIKNHVKYGLELAQEYKLPPPVIDIIAQHHGTSLITYFYHKALELKEDNKNSEELDEMDFRYPGPKPQSAESAIVMLADSVEAAVASISNPTESSIQSMVRKVVNDKFTDEQLDECDITLRDLHLITESLVRSLLSKYHRRIEYPDI